MPDLASSTRDSATATRADRSERENAIEGPIRRRRPRAVPADLTSEVSVPFESEKPVLSPWIVVAAYNEAARIDNTLQGLRRLGYHQIIVVDDGSRDATAKVATKSAAVVLRHPINCGQGAAIQTGIDFALQRGASLIVTFDADGQHDPAEISRLVDPIANGEVDVVLGSRFRGQTVAMPWTRRWLLRAAILHARLTTRLPVSDTHNGFRAFSRNAAQTVRIRQPRMAHASEILEEVARHRLAWVEAPVTIRYSQETLAKGQTGWDAIRIGLQLMVGRFVR